MDRLLIALGLALMLSLLPARAGVEDDGARAVFFSMLFAQLAPGCEATPGEAVAL